MLILAAQEDDQVLVETLLAARCDVNKANTSVRRYVWTSVL